MLYTDCLRYKPWLKVCNINNICNRLLAKTKQNAFLVYNTIQQTYELHTVDAFRLSGDSYNATIPQNLLNNFIINDYNANNFEHSLDDFISDKLLSEIRNEKFEESRRPAQLNNQLKIIERVIGTRG